jgi:peptidoglycan hydrolase FlgJ
MSVGNINSSSLNGIISSNIENAAGKLNTDISNNINTASFETQLKSAIENGDEKKLKQTCQDFESIFLGMMYKEMRATVPKSDLIPDNSGTELYQGMLDDQLVQDASKVTSNQRLGLADILYKQLSQQLKSANKPNNGEEGSTVGKNP